jgi:uncharacterized protein
MLRHTFCHIPGIGPKTEKSLWANGLLSWDDALNEIVCATKPHCNDYVKSRIRESRWYLERRDARNLARSLPTNQHWRMFGEFRDATAYLDIETSGGASGFDHITTIALYDGETIFHYVWNENLHQFREDIIKYDLIVTFNGKSFDIPMIKRCFGIRVDQAHIDLLHVLRSLGYRGGLKGCERKLGLHRAELDGVDGYCAVLLWAHYVRTADRKALDTLLAYNVLDAVNLETLMVTAYNLKLAETPFYKELRLPLPEPPHNPFDADEKTISRIMSIRGFSSL